MVDQLKIFISSPSDVTPERRRAALVVEKLAKEYARFLDIKPILWETEPMLASGHFQDAIIPPAETDILVMILWSRLGMPLPERTDHHEYHGIDGRVPVTGTEWEFENALQANKTKGVPDLLAYRKIAKPRMEFGSEAEAIELGRQFKLLSAFWDHYFFNKGEFHAAFWEFADLVSFEQRLDSDLRKLIGRRIATLHHDVGNLIAPTWSKGSPFRGLETYRFEHAHIFFGRNDATKTAVERFVENAEAGLPFLLILGASGSGKSSLAQAGVAPALGAPGVVPGVGEWRRTTMRPANDPKGPFASLAAALTIADALPELLNGQNAIALARHLESATADPAFPIVSALAAREQIAREQQSILPHESIKLLLVVDQLEELFTLSDVTPACRNSFIACLEGLLGSGRIFILATMRNDYWHRTSEVPRLVTLAEGRGRFDLLNATQAEITEIIRRPAESAGLTFETDSRTEIRLDAALAEEAAREPGALPLLSFLLDALYSKDVDTDRRSTLTYASMRALGGLRGAIATRAEAAISVLPADLQNVFPKVLRALATVTRSGAEPTARAAPMARFPDGSVERLIIEALLHPQMRLLVADGDGAAARVRLAHEALITHWERAKRQIAQDRDDLRTRAIVEEAEAEWRRAAAAEKNSYLLRDPQLANAIDLVSRWNGELDSATCTFVRASRRRAHLRQRLTTAAAVLFAVVALLAIGAASEAVHERRLAQKTLAAATQTTNALIFDLAQRFRNSVGIPTQLVRDILRRAMALQQDLSASGQGTPDLKFSEADALAENAQTLLLQGDTDGALHAGQRARDILLDLIQKNVKKTEWRHDLAVIYETIGDAFTAVGQRQEALTAYQNALAYRQQLAAEVPKNSGYQHDLAVGFLKVGDILLSAEKLDDAMAAYRRSVGFEQKAADLGQPSQDSRHDLSISLERIGDLILKQGKIDDALSAYRKSLDIRHDLVAHNADNSDWQRDLSISYERIGDVMASLGRRDDAVASLLDSLDVPTLAVSAEDVSARRQISAPTEDGRDNHRTGDADYNDAIMSYQKSLTIRRRLADADRGNAEWQRDLSIGYIKLGDVLDAEQKRRDALSAYKSGLSAAERLPRTGKGNVEWQRDAYVAQERIGDLQMKNGKFQEALAAYQDSLTKRRNLVAVDPSNSDWQRDLSIIEEKIGDLRLSMGQRDLAFADYQDSVAVRQRLAAGGSGNLQRQRELANGYLKVGDVLVAQGRRNEALSAYLKGMVLARTASGTKSDNPSDDLPFSLARAASTLISLGRPAQALSYLNERAHVRPNDASVYFDRGNAELYSDLISRAVDDLSKAVSLQANNPYFVIWFHIAQQRAKQNDKLEFVANAQKLDHVKWPWPVISLLLGSSDPQGVVQAAQKGDSPRARNEHTCEAEFYVGAYDADRDLKDAAIEFFHSAVTDCPQNYLEKAAAKLELERLAGTPALRSNK